MTVGGIQNRFLSKDILSESRINPLILVRENEKIVKFLFLDIVSLFLDSRVSTNRHDLLFTRSVFSSPGSYPRLIYLRLKYEDPNVLFLIACHSAFEGFSL